MKLKLVHNDTPEYHVDNATVFDILNGAVGDHKNVKPWIKSYARMKNGRAAWKSFKNHYRGTNQMEAMEANAVLKYLLFVLVFSRIRFKSTCNLELD
jgi:hypothetical protein